jgi:hypothetical protein
MRLSLRRVGYVADVECCEESFLGILEMYPTQAKKRLEWATHHSILSPILGSPVW